MLFVYNGENSRAPQAFCKLCRGWSIQENPAGVVTKTMSTQQDILEDLLLQFLTPWHCLSLSHAFNCSPAIVRLHLPSKNSAIWQINRRIGIASSDFGWERSLSLRPVPLLNQLFSRSPFLRVLKLSHVSNSSS